MNNEQTLQLGWHPLTGSWEEAVVDWHEQVTTAFQRRKEPTHETKSREMTRANTVVTQ